MKKVEQGMDKLKIFLENKGILASIVGARLDQFPSKVTVGATRELTVGFSAREYVIRSLGGLADIIPQKDKDYLLDEAHRPVHPGQDEKASLIQLLEDIEFAKNAYALVSNPEQAETRFSMLKKRYSNRMTPHQKRQNMMLGLGEMESSMGTFESNLEKSSSLFQARDIFNKAQLEFPR